MNSRFPGCKSSSYTTAHDTLNTGSCDLFPLTSQPPRVILHSQNFSADNGSAVNISQNNFMKFFVKCVVMEI